MKTRTDLCRHTFIHKCITLATLSLCTFSFIMTPTTSAYAFRIESATLASPTNPTITLPHEMKLRMADTHIKLAGDKDLPIYFFGEYEEADDEPVLPKKEGRNPEQKFLLGGKGMGLAQMAALRKEFVAWLKTHKPASRPGAQFDNGEIAEMIIPEVPRGFTITTEQTRRWFDNLTEEEKRRLKETGSLPHGKLSEEQKYRIKEALKLMEKASKQKLGNRGLDGSTAMPLLISVRSGAAESMPGMMDTVLNLGMNDKARVALAANTNEWFAWDSHRRFIQMFGETVLGIEDTEEEGFTKMLNDKVKKEAVADESKLSLKGLQDLVNEYKAFVAKKELVIPDDPLEQYLMAVETVMQSTFTARAMRYRDTENLKLEDTLSAVNVQMMVFGNLNGQSGSGVAFTRDGATGENVWMGDFGLKAQGEDVVKGRVKGYTIDKLIEIGTQKEEQELNKPSIEAVGEALFQFGEFIEEHRRNAQDMEFTFEYKADDQGKMRPYLYMLQTRDAKRSSVAEVVMAYDMMFEKKILLSEHEAVDRVNPSKMGELLTPQFDKDDKDKALNDPEDEERYLLSDGGLNASPGAGVGRIVFDSEEAHNLMKATKAARKQLKLDEPKLSEEEIEERLPGVILVRDETSPEDIDGMLAADAIVTQKGGRTSHAAVVARQFGTPAVVGDSNLEIDFINKTLTIRQPDGKPPVILKQGDIISVDGTGEKGKGQIIKGRVKTVPSIIATARHIEGLPKAKEAVRLLKMWQKALRYSSKPEDQALFAEYAKHIKDYQEHIELYERDEKQLSPEEEEFMKKFNALEKLAQKHREDNHGLGVHANAEKPLDVLNAIMLGAEGFGLVRTEHMFSGDITDTKGNVISSRELKFQKMILAGTEDERIAALEEILPFQQADFEQIFIYAKGKPVTIRLLDPPLHEFLPSDEKKIQKLADYVGMSVRQVKKKINELQEENPMFATRGTRLGILHEEITRMQSRAIFEAAQRVKAAGIEVKLEIMNPLVGNGAEIEFAKERIEEIAEEKGFARDEFLVGTMIETIAGVLNIEEIAKHVQFISFGTNDLTQGALKISRDDGKLWLQLMKDAGDFEADPFVSLHRVVAKFIERTVQNAKAVNPNIKIGICGEQGVDIKSIRETLGKVGLNYVSGSSRRIPAARWALSQESRKGHTPLAPERSWTIPSTVKKDGEEISGLEYMVTQLDPNEEAPTTEPRMSIKTQITSETQSVENVGMIELEKILMEDKEIKELLQLLLLGKDDKELEHLERENKKLAQKLVDQQDKNVRLLEEKLQARLGMYQLEGTLPLRLPDLALQDLLKGAKKRALAKKLGIKGKELNDKIKKYHELNPGIGTRGIRMVSIPQAEKIMYAVVRATIQVAEQQEGIDNIDFLVPFVTEPGEIQRFRENLENAINDLKPTKITKETARIGTIVETPAAAQNAEEIAERSEFVLIDVKKLTEAVWAWQEIDARKPKSAGPVYLEKKIWDRDIFIFVENATRQLMAEAIDAIKSSEKEGLGEAYEIGITANAQDQELLALAEFLGVDTLIVEPENVVPITTMAAQATATFSEALTFVRPELIEEPQASRAAANLPDGSIEDFALESA
ncbi:putative PEP-binding protein [Candidatus Omnitrophota bacterium]